MQSKINFLLKLQKILSHKWQRYGLLLQGSDNWQYELLKELKTTQENEQKSWFSISQRKFVNVIGVNDQYGKELLGQECDVLIFDITDLTYANKFDANSFMSGLGTLVGGGLLIILLDPKINLQQLDLITNSMQKWLLKALQKFILLQEKESLPNLSLLDNESHTYINDSKILYVQQQKIIASLTQMLMAKTKKTIVLTASRGRGKSSALGITSGFLLVNILKQQTLNAKYIKQIKIVVTAPNAKAAHNIFLHAQRIYLAGQKQLKLTKEMVQCTSLSLITQNGSLEFIAPDNLCQSLPKCDVLLIDEAASLPVSILQIFAQNYQRIVFASTNNGYEGAARGFSLKFLPWLATYRPMMKYLSLQQPIRWSTQDLLEKWANQLFLINAKLKKVDNVIKNSNQNNLRLCLVNKEQLLADLNLLEQIFALLVSAHYQTSPNDLIHLLADEKINVHIALLQEQLVGVILTAKEGNLSSDLILDIKLGKRRPKGHLAAINLATNLGITQAAQCTSTRIMRIATHPELQSLGFGQQMLQLFKQQLPVDHKYISVSYGLTTELYHFWQRAQFKTMTLGTKRDAASGAYSILMIYSQDSKVQNWIIAGYKSFNQFLQLGIGELYQQLEIELLKLLWEADLNINLENFKELELLKIYAENGLYYEAIYPWLLTLLKANLLTTIPNVVIDKVIKQLSWQECAKKYKLTGRKQIEQEIKKWIQQYLGYRIYSVNRDKL